MKYIKKIIAALLCAAALLSLCGCKGNSVLDTISSLGKSEEEPGIDEIGFSIPYLRTDSLNPYKATGTMNKYLSVLLYDSLFHVDNGFNAEYLIAQSHTLSRTGLSVKIKSGLKFTDGTALSASDVVYSFNLAKKSTNYSFFLDNIKRAEASGSDCVIFTLSVTNENEISNLVFPIIKSSSDVQTTESAQAEDDGDTTAVKTEYSSKIPVGSGRYTVVTGKEIKYLQVNKERLGGYHPKYNMIGLVDVTDTKEYQSLFNLGEIDFYCNDFSSGSYEKFTEINNTVALTNFVYLGINSKKSKVLSEPKVRRAMALALDRTELSSVSFAGCAVASPLPFHPSYYALGGCTLPTLKAKTDSSAELLDEVGFSAINDSGARYSDAGALSLTLLVNSENDFRRSLARGIQQAFEKVSIKVTIKEVSYSDYLSSIENESFDLYIGETRLSNDFGLSRFFASDGSLRYGIDSASKSAKLYNKYVTGEINLQKFIDTFSDELPFIPISFRSGIAVRSGKIKNDIATLPGDCFANIEDWTAQ